MPRMAGKRRKTSGLPHSPRLMWSRRWALSFRKPGRWLWAIIADSVRVPWLFFFPRVSTCVKTKRDEPTIISKTPNQLYHAARAKTAAIAPGGVQRSRKMGLWVPLRGHAPTVKKNEQYPHFVFYDFEALHDKSQARPTSRLAYEAVHVPISVSIGDTKEREPTFIVDGDPKQLVVRFM